MAKSSRGIKSCSSRISLNIQLQGKCLEITDILASVPMVDVSDVLSRVFVALDALDDA